MQRFKQRGSRSPGENAHEHQPLSLTPSSSSHSQSFLHFLPLLLKQDIWGMNTVAKVAFFDSHRRAIHRATDRERATFDVLNGNNRVILRLRHAGVQFTPDGLSEFLTEGIPPVAQQEIAPGGLANGILADAISSTPHVAGSVVTLAAAAEEEEEEEAPVPALEFSPPYDLELRFPSADVEISRAVADALREHPFNAQVQRMTELGYTDIGNERALDANYDVIMLDDSGDDDDDDSTGSDGGSRTRQRVTYMGTRRRVAPPLWSPPVVCNRHCCSDRY